MAVILFFVLFLTLFLGIPISLCMGFSVFVTLVLTGSRIPPIMITQRMFTSLDNFIFLAVPFFILAGEIMQRGGISKRLVSFAQSILAGLPASLSVITTVSSCFFGAISGSNPATVAAIGGLMIPRMIETGYPKSRAAAIAAAAGTLGVVIPPSISMITYSMMANVSVGSMFISGVVPGLLMTVVISVVSMLLCKGYETNQSLRLAFREMLSVFAGAVWALLMPAIILGGIYGGIFTPTEAAAVSCAYAFFVGKYVYKELTMGEMVNVMVRTARSTAVVLFIVSMASSFSWLMTSTGIPGYITETLLGVFHNKYVLLLMMNVALLFFGCFLETQSIILLMTPILLPLAAHLDLHPIALGIVMVINTSIGMVTPPRWRSISLSPAAYRASPSRR
ncbi:MAG: TRAP transporter large permease [Planctomycetaceae bacterium]|nr:TRAP transporter large permease [Planctomycetaceae bacterium]